MCYERLHRLLDMRSLVGGRQYLVVGAQALWLRVIRLLRSSYPD